jgi:putative CRISPR-associated protein (TIGR02619 family)
MPNLIVSTCGTSILTNDSGVLRALLNKHTNLKSVSECPSDERLLIENHLRQRIQDVLRASDTELAKLSAEMNALLKFYGGKSTTQDMHILIHTDTWLGRETGKTLRSVLEQRGFAVDTPPIPDLRTDNVAGFQSAMSDLIKWAAETLPNYRQQQYKVVFNLNGGFKSIQGFMQTLAMLYADESIYLFETGKELLRLPRLPIRMDAEQAVRDNFTVLRQLALSLPYDKTVAATLLETFVLPIDDDITLSPWGELVWAQHKNTLYSENLQPTPTLKISFTANFKRSIEGLQADRYLHLNQQIDKLAAHLHDKNGKNIKSLDVKALHVPRHGGCTHEFDAWHDQNAKRVFGWLKGDTFTCEILENGVGH